MHFRMAAGVALAMVLAACGPGDTKKIEKGGEGAAPQIKTPDVAPDRLAFEGCRWEKVAGAGLTLWSQVCANQRLVGDDAAGVIWLEATFEGRTDRGENIRVFPVPDSGLKGLTELLMKEGGAPAGATCALEVAPNVVERPAGLARYALQPIGDTKAAWDKANDSDLKEEDGPCGRFGVATIGDRYIEIQAAHPDKAIFVELGSEIQIYDPNTIAFAAASAGHSEKSKAGGH